MERFSHTTHFQTHTFNLPPSSPSHTPPLPPPPQNRTIKSPKNTFPSPKQSQSGISRAVTLIPVSCHTSLAFLYQIFQSLTKLAHGYCRS